MIDTVGFACRREMELECRFAKKPRTRSSKLSLIIMKSKKNARAVKQRGKTSRASSTDNMKKMSDQERIEMLWKRGLTLVFGTI
jgi:hypothetical protein